MRFAFAFAAKARFAESGAREEMLKRFRGVIVVERTRRVLLHVAGRPRTNEGEHARRGVVALARGAIGGEDAKPRCELHQEVASIARRRDLISNGRSSGNAPKKRAMIPLTAGVAKLVPVFVV
ncbi:hypothetical protein BH09MYX1_BH09MYX1_04260 [soil metagenome]